MNQSTYPGKFHLMILFIFLGFQSLGQKNGKPNILYILVDQWRAQSIGYAGDKNVMTPHLDQLAKSSINLTHAVSGMPVCSPHRASFLTGQYPLTHGVFMNDVLLDSNRLTIGKIFKENGYQTGYIGKWHMDGHGRSSYIPASRQQGFNYWKALECTHDYQHSAYYEGDTKEKKFWKTYDAIAQTEDVCDYIKKQSKKDDPFFLVLSIGSPHDPYQTAPEKYRKMYEDKSFVIRENVPQEKRMKVQNDLKGYYAHMTAIDDCIGQLRKTLKDQGLDKNTILVFTSDHGDLMGSHGAWNKQQPYDESIRVPFLIHYPKALGIQGRTSKVLFNSPDIMPTILGLSGFKVPNSVEGKDFSSILLGKKKNDVQHTLISCVQPFGQWSRANGGKEYRGLMTEKYTYVRDLQGPWLLFDRTKDPFQLNNLIGNPGFIDLQNKLDRDLKNELKKRNDEFLPGLDYVKKWKYVIDATETVPYVKMNYQGLPINESSSGYPVNLK
jgi:arylsulfatase A-like enzyme